MSRGLPLITRKKLTVTPVDGRPVVGRNMTWASDKGTPSQPHEFPGPRRERVETLGEPRQPAVLRPCLGARRCEPAGGA